MTDAHTNPTRTPDQDRRQRRWPWLVAILTVHLVLVAPGLIAHFASPERIARYGEQDPRPVPPEWRDADGYHLPVIDRMREQWPNIDIVHYDAATAPGYQVFMATIGVVIGGREGNVDQALWVVNAIVGLALIAAIFFTTVRLARPPAAFLLCLPLACSSYLVAGSTWLTTDNAAMLFGTLVLSGVMALCPTVWSGVRLGIYATLAVAIRQSFAWLAAPIALAGLLGSPLRRFAPRAFRDESNTPKNWTPCIGGALGAALPLSLTGFLILQWGGLLPQSSDGWSELHNLGPNLATPAYALALAMSLGVFFLPIVWRELCELKHAPLAPIICASLALIAAVVVPTASTRSTEEWGSGAWRVRNYGVLWRVVDEAPVLARRSLLIAILAPLGAVFLVLLYRTARRAGCGPQALILLTSLSGWLAAQTMNSMAWQRYFEPTILLALAWLCAMSWDRVWIDAGPMRRRLLLAGPCALALGLVALTVYKLHRPSLGVAFG